MKMEVTLEIDRMERLNIMTSTTGGVRGKSTNPALREQPDEIAQSAYECYKAGASVCHIRVHNKQGRSKETWRFKTKSSVRSRPSVP